ncbi:EP1-like glycoprotein 2 [Papaver somniferum]|uniref:EP1-like glycoprotein 2 n=1 Tax=Papaver somniferum TaxID=3469 RepID=UPI000E6F535E|nr:EP1-like glycoprotein 2 [Papaver somniferum]
MSSLIPFSIFFFTIIFFSSSFVAESAVPSSKTFKFINQGDFGDYIVEYDANYRALDLFSSPFQLCFYNTTPNAFTLALRMGLVRSESIMRWVWDANRGNPVRENATLTFGTDGNLVLSDADGQIAWQTGTANKDVVGLNLLSNGNIVLYDKSGKYIWQSFEHPSDTLLVGQGLRPNGPNRITSRVSDVDGSEGPYSFVLEKSRLNLYLKSKNLKKPLLYYTSDWFGTSQGVLTQVLFNATPESEEAYAYELTFEFFVANSSTGTSILTRPKYNSTLSLLRLGFDGSLKVYTYYDKVSHGAWEVTFSLFDLINGNNGVSQCKLPSRCGSFGVCEDEQCVACPTANGLLGWSKNCAPPTLRKCDNGKANKVDYFKVVGVEHFMDDYNKGEGSLELDECRSKCSKDCQCLGFFYKQESSKCLLAPVLGTLNKVANTSHVAYIKV